MKNELLNEKIQECEKEVDRHVSFLGLNKEGKVLIVMLDSKTDEQIINTGISMTEQELEAWGEETKYCIFS